MAETCNGTTPICPADGLSSSGTVCRVSTGGCDPAESCTGRSAACPADTTIPNCGDLTLTTPAGVSFQDVTLGATFGVTVELGATVSAKTTSAVLTDMPTGADPGIDLFSLATAGTAYSINSITLQPGAELVGNALSPNILTLPGSSIGGTKNTNPTLLPPSTAKFTVVFPATQSGDVSALPLIPRTLDPGRYGKVTVYGLGTLRLRSGSYYVDSIAASLGSSIEIDDSAGPVILFTRLSFDLQGALTSSTRNRQPPLSIVDIGSLPSDIKGAFHGPVVAPLAPLSLGAPNVQLKGAYFGKSIEIESGATVYYEPPNDLVPLFFPPTKGVQACAEAIRKSDDALPAQQNAVYQTELARHCTAPEASTCIATLIGRANADYSAAALQTLNHTMTPSQYLGLSRTRRHRLSRAEKDPTYAASLCNDPDADHDWVPDSSDNCLSTPDLTPVDDSGCPLPASSLPQGPSMSDVDNLLTNTNIMINPLCRDAPAPTTVSGAAVWQTANPSAGVFIVSTAVQNQPKGCTVWYVFEIRILDSTGAPTGAPFQIAYPDTQTVANIGGLPDLPLVPSKYVQFVAKTSDPDARADLAALAGKRIGITFRVQAVNGRGARGPWSDWKSPTETDCLQLGVFCAE